MKRKLFQVDFNLWHYFCNMSCCYCIKHIPFVRKENVIFIWDDKSKEYKRYATVSSMIHRAEICLEKLFTIYEVNILTFSGSEPFLFPEILKLINFAVKNANYVQVITNGCNLNYNIIKNIEKMGENIQISLSLDGNLLKSNYARTYENEKKLNKILGTLDLLVESSLNFDIMTVLSKFNIKYLQTFLKYLDKYERNICVQMWPAFGSNDVGLKTEDEKYISELLRHFDEYKLKLQPYTYFVKLQEYLLKGERNIPCFLVKDCVYLNDLGEMKLCPCNGLVKIQNIVNNVFYQYSLHSFYGSNTFVSLPCKKCFINWDVINLYLVDEIKLNELIEMPIFSNTNVIYALKQLKEEFKMEN